ncbi:hypothetical protein [Vibrio sonorensis]|uniref:hypothetical protein n=1 Tax=Vibrio sonorensis TaxID=1004316 RepID=UPI0008D9C433|nr:hypothetical protein [Vibrio sonorensis]
MKASELRDILNSLPEDVNPDIVTGEEWLPEQLTQCDHNGQHLFLQFDNAPEDIQGEEEGRGFVEHEIEMIRHKFEQILDDASDTKTKADAMLALFLMGHEKSSSEIIEVLEDPEVPNSPE